VEAALVCSADNAASASGRRHGGRGSGAVGGVRRRSQAHGRHEGRHLVSVARRGRAERTYVGVGGDEGRGQRRSAVCMYRAVCVYKVRRKSRSVPCWSCAMRMNEIEIEIGTALGHSNLGTITMSPANESNPPSSSGTPPCPCRRCGAPPLHCHFTAQPPPTRATHLSSSIHRESRPAGGLLMPSALRWRPRHVLFSPSPVLCACAAPVPVSCCRATLSSMRPSTMQLETTANRERPNDVIEHARMTGKYHARL
jgi:hypothetical protein